MDGSDDVSVAVTTVCVNWMVAVQHPMHDNRWRSYHHPSRLRICTNSRACQIEVLCMRAVYSYQHL